MVAVLQLPEPLPAAEVLDLAEELNREQCHHFADWWRAVAGFAAILASPDGVDEDPADVIARAALEELLTPDRVARMLAGRTG